MSRVRAVFVNSGMLGHASVASLIADAIARDPGIEATHLSLAEPNGRGERLVRAVMCARPLGRTNLDLARWRSEMHSGLVASRRLRRLMASGTGRVDVLHFHTQATAYRSLGLMARTPSIVSIDITQPLASLEAPEALRATYRPNVAHDGAVFRRARAIVATSRWAADDLKRVYPECAGNVTVLPYPVRLEKADREWIELRRRRTDAGPVRFLFMGGDFVRKGGPDLLRAWQEGGFAPSHRLTLATDWPGDEHLLPPGVEIVRGVRAYTQAWRDLWRDADIFVMPARAEAFGMVFQEAAAAGLPAIGPRINAVPEIVDDGVTGHLVPPGDARALVEAMRGLAASADRRHVLGRAARDRMEARGTVDRYGEVLSALVHDVARTAVRRNGVATRGRKPSAIERVGRALAAPLRQGPVRSAAARLLEAALDMRSAGRGLECRLPGGEIVRVLPKYRAATWNLDEYRAFRSVVGPGAVVLDVGASVGSYAMLFGQWTRPHGRVYAFEPAPDIRAVLERHVAINDLDGIVVPVAAAASDAIGRSTFVTPGPHGISRLTAAGESSPLLVETITIDEFCRREAVRPDLIKIDVEGAELAVLRGARDTLRACRRDIAVFVELHPTLWPTLGVTREQIEAELARLGLFLEPSAAGGDPWRLEGVALRLRCS